MEILPRCQRRSAAPLLRHAWKYALKLYHSLCVSEDALWEAESMSLKMKDEASCFVSDRNLHINSRARQQLEI